jgi:hypothetical protein
MDGPTRVTGGVRGYGLEQAADREIPKAPSPQLISTLTDQLRGLHELRSRLASVNKVLRGIPASRAENGVTEKEPEITLDYLCQAIGRTIELCHQEIAETSALLS